MPLSLRLSSPSEEGMMQVSKSLKHPVLLDVEEMRSLLQHLGEFHLFQVSSPVLKQEAEISIGTFLKYYAAYVEGIKSGALVDEKILRPFFSAAMTKDVDALYAIPLGENKVLVKPIKPVIQMSLNHFIHSAFDEKFHLGVQGQGSITWGIQFTYPQLYQHPKTKMIVKVEKNTLFPNTELFSLLGRWMRQNTLPTPFIYNNQRTNVPLRLGKSCFAWINNHPGLVPKTLKVMEKYGLSDH